MVSLYFHIPFCTKKCHYCHFYVIPDNETHKKQLAEGFKLEWDSLAAKLSTQPIETIYFGGGTPSLLGPSFIQDILSWISFPKGIEITLEANPEDVTFDLMKAYHDAGINRVSLGIQTLNDPLLMKLGRLHDSKKAIQAVEKTAQAGISNISIDLMYDLPDQTLPIWEETLDRVIATPITHLSLYNLTIEPHTVFFKQREIIKKALPDEETSLKMYETACEKLNKGGLIQYEISAFARNGLYSRHNIGYWTARPFFGLGPSAFSYYEGKRFRNIAHLNRYHKALKEGQSPIDFEEALPEKEKTRELLAIHLRLMDGVELDRFELDPETVKTLRTLEQEDYLAREHNRLKLTRKGILFYDTVAIEII